MVVVVRRWKGHKSRTNKNYEVKYYPTILFAEECERQGWRDYLVGKEAGGGKRGEAKRASWGWQSMKRGWKAVERGRKAGEMGVNRGWKGGEKEQWERETWGVINDFFFRVLKCWLDQPYQDQDKDKTGNSRRISNISSILRPPSVNGRNYNLRFWFWECRGGQRASCCLKWNIWRGGNR